MKKLLLLLVIISIFTVSCENSSYLKTYLADLVVQSIKILSYNNEPNLGINKFVLSFFNIPADNGETQIASTSHFLFQLLKLYVNGDSTKFSKSSVAEQETTLIDEYIDECGTIEPGEREDKEIEIEIDSVGTYIVRVFIDCNNEVAERNEDNNQNEIVFKIDTASTKILSIK